MWFVTESGSPDLCFIWMSLCLWATLVLEPQVVHHIQTPGEVKILYSNQVQTLRRVAAEIGTNIKSLMGILRFYMRFLSDIF